jgi:sigma-B regulation protein RsbU (phosphoserine phosphatase)
MQPGDTLFLYTDGLTEARNIRRELFGRERVMRLMETCDTTDAKAFVDSIVMEVQRFADGAEQSDDLTLLAIRYTPKEEKLILDESLTLHNDVKEVTALSAFIKEVLARLEIGKPLAPKLRLALEEAVVNVMEYAYPTGTKGEVGIRVTSDGQQLKFIITDSGISFNPTEVATADTTLSAEERPVGGLGILLVRELMDSINYERTNGKNVLTLLKNVKIIKCKNE